MLLQYYDIQHFIRQLKLVDIKQNDNFPFAANFFHLDVLLQ